MVFCNEKHMEFFKEKFANLTEREQGDRCLVSLLYVLSLNDDIRKNFSEVFDIEDKIIKVSGLEAPWQTSTNLKITRLAFNLFNNFMFDSENELEKFKISTIYTPDNIFCCSNARYLFEDIKIKYPEYMKISKDEIELF